MRSRTGNFHIDRLALAIEIHAFDLANTTFGGRSAKTDRARTGKGKAKDEFFKRSVATPVRFKEAVEIRVGVDASALTEDNRPSVQGSGGTRPARTWITKCAVIE